MTRFYEILYIFVLKLNIIIFFKLYHRLEGKYEKQKIKIIKHSSELEGMLIKIHKW
jgi:hypothetical protein